MKTRLFLSATIGLALSAAVGHAQIIPIALSGSTQYDGWGNFGTMTGQYGSFPGGGSWASPIGSNLAGSGDAQITKTNGSGGGGPFVGSESLYFGGFGNGNTFGGTLTFSDPSVVSNLKTVVFQLQYGEAFGYDFYNDNSNIQLTLQTSEGSLIFSADYFALLNFYQDGTFENPNTGEDEPVYVNTYGYQWDFTALYSTYEDFAISSYSLTFSGAQHSQVRAAQFNQSDTFTQVIPEPSTYALMALGLGLVAWKVRRRVKEA